jgi:hypothetical protein
MLVDLSKLASYDRMPEQRSVKHVRINLNK